MRCARSLAGRTTSGDTQSLEREHSRRVCRGTHAALPASHNVQITIGSGRATSRRYHARNFLSDQYVEASYAWAVTLTSTSTST